MCVCVCVCQMVGLVLAGGLVQLADDLLHKFVTEPWTAPLSNLERLDKSLDGSDPATSFIHSYAILQTGIHHTLTGTNHTLTGTNHK